MLDRFHLGHDLGGHGLLNGQDQQPRLCGGGEVGGKIDRPVCTKRAIRGDKNFLQFGSAPKLGKSRTVEVICSLRQVNIPDRLGLVRRRFCTAQ